MIALKIAVVGLLLAVAIPASAKVNTAAKEPEVRDVSADKMRMWSGRRADTLPEGRWEVGVFGPLKYGLTPNLELATHPLAFFVAPNVTAKVLWNDDRPWRLASRHGVIYPTPLLNIVSKEGVGGILPSTTKVPHIFGLTNEVLATTNVPLFRRWFTLRLGFTVAPRFGGDPLPAIELPVLFPRTAAYGAFGTGYAGASMEGEIAGPFYFLLDTAMFVIPGYPGAYTFEHTVQFSWRTRSRFLALAGVRAIQGGYPYGERFHALPMLDVKFGF